MPDHKLSGVLRPHISLDVKDVTASIAFYQALFGMEPKKVKYDYAKFELQNPPLSFSMNQKTAEIKEHGALNHLGFEVATNADVLSAKRTARILRSYIVR